jgi:hypothetical protein
MIFIRRLIWDAWNVAHIARHAVVPEEVEQVCHGDFIVRPRTASGCSLLGRPRLDGYWPPFWILKALKAVTTS